LSNYFLTKIKMKKRGKICGWYLHS